MAHKLEFHPEAKVELDAALSWYPDKEVTIWWPLFVCILFSSPPFLHKIKLL